MLRLASVKAWRHHLLSKASGLETVSSDIEKHLIGQSSGSKTFRVRVGGCPDKVSNLE